MSSGVVNLSEVQCPFSGELCPAKQKLVEDYREDEDYLAEIGEVVKEEDLQRALLAHDQHAPTRYCADQVCRPETAEEPLNWGQRFIRFIVDHATR